MGMATDIPLATIVSLHHLHGQSGLSCSAPSGTLSASGTQSYTDKNVDFVDVSLRFSLIEHIKTCKNLNKVY